MNLAPKAKPKQALEAQTRRKLGLYQTTVDIPKAANPPRLTERGCPRVRQDTEFPNNILYTIISHASGYSELPYFSLNAEYSTTTRRFRVGPQIGQRLRDAQPTLQVTENMSIPLPKHINCSRDGAKTRSRGQKLFEAAKSFRKVLLTDCRPLRMPTPIQPSASFFDCDEPSSGVAYALT